MAVAIDIKSELKQLIESESDTSILQAIRTLLTKTSLDSTLKERLSKRALKSEENIATGHFFSKEEMIKRSNDYLAK